MVNGSITVSLPICTSTSIVVAVGVDDAHAGAHVPLVDRALGEPAHVRERHAIVDPEHEALVREHVRRDRLSVGAQEIEHLRQIQLALGVVGAQAWQRALQRARVEGEDAGVDLSDLELLGARVAVRLGLHDALHRAVGAAHDPAVAGGIVEHRRHHRGGRAALRVHLGQAADRLRADERHIPAEHHHDCLVVEPPEPSWARAAATAPPVPFELGCTASSTPSGSTSASARWGESTTTTRSAPASRAACTGHSTIGRPHSSCSTFGVRERMRVPWPAARTRTVGAESPS